jgi:tRNA U55 pseudouridine synthase TruB
MQRYTVINKHVGETPLEAMEAWRVREGVPTNIPLAYAGRLDPMASGALIVLIGDECKRQKLYQSYNKEYRFEILLGFGSDTGDILGLAERGTDVHPTESEILHAVHSLKGSRELRYPRFSAKTVRGVPLHEWTLRGGLPDSDIPTYTATVLRARFENARSVSAAEVQEYIRERITRIPPVTDPRKALGADFRRNDILPRWDSLLLNPSEQFLIIQASATVSSGTYIRTLAEVVGTSLGTRALAYSIHRTRIGTYHTLPFELGWWSPIIARAD